MQKQYHTRDIHNKTSHSDATSYGCWKHCKTRMCNKNKARNVVACEEDTCFKTSGRCDGGISGTITWIVFSLIIFHIRRIPSWILPNRRSKLDHEHHHQLLDLSSYMSRF